MNRQDLIAVGLGEKPADVVVKNGTLVNVHTREIYKAGVAIKGDRIAFVGEVNHTVGEKTQVLDASDRFLVPGFLDPHIHTGETCLSIGNFARVVVPHGTTGIANDFTEVHEVSGPRGVRFQLDEAKRTPLKIYFFIMQQVMKAGILGTHPRSESRMEAEFRDMLSWPENVGIYEPPLAPVLARDPLVMGLIELAWKQKKLILGHYPFPIGRELGAYLTIGAYSDHESKTSEDALAKARLGMRMIVRECSPSPDLTELVKLIKANKLDSRYAMFCTDDEDAYDLIRKGHLDYKLRLAVKEGVDPITAVQMATINVAEYWNLDGELGSIVPGKLADLVILDNLSEFNVEMVLANGEVVAQDGRYLAGGRTAARTPAFMKDLVRVRRPLRPADFDVETRTAADSATVRVIGVADGTFLRKWETATLKVEHGRILPDVSQDVIMAAVVECHRGSGNIARGFTSGFNLRGGAIAITHDHPFQNLVVVGDSSEEMSFAANRAVKLHGGFVVVEGKKVLAELPLPFGGVMTYATPEKVYEGFSKVNEAIRGLGCTHKSPFMTLGFITITAIPDAAITDRGLVDVETQKFVSLIIAPRVT